MEVDDDAAVGEPASSGHNQGQAKATQSSQSAPSQADSTSSGSSQSLATPAVRAMVKEHKLDIKQIKGSGKDGRVMKEDVLNFMNKTSGAQTTSAATTSASKEAPKQAAPQAEKPAKKEAKKEEAPKAASRPTPR